MKIINQKTIRIIQLNCGFFWVRNEFQLLPQGLAGYHGIKIEVTGTSEKAFSGKVESLFLVKASLYLSL